MCAGCAAERCVVLTAGAAIAALLFAGARWGWTRLRHAPTQKDIDAAVLHTLEIRSPLPPPPRARMIAVRRSRWCWCVASARGDDAKTGDGDIGRSIGSGVVIVDSGIILTNMHVVAGSAKISVRFADGTESVANVVSIQPEHGSRRAAGQTLPDDLQAATMRSTGDLALGDEVIAVGFPFAIGPVGLRRGRVWCRDYMSPQGQRGR